MRGARPREGRGSKFRVLGKHKASKASKASAHLELRSPMFGEFCIWFFFVSISMEFMKSKGVLLQKLNIGNRR